MPSTVGHCFASAFDALTLGLIAFASLFPIMLVIAYAQLSQWREHRRAKETPRR